MSKVITIDGPSGSGKGTAAHRIAAIMHYHLLDSGAIYRLAALKAIRLSVSLDDESEVLKAIENLDIGFDIGQELTIPLLDSQDVSKEIRSEKAGEAASIIAQYPSIRSALLQRQRDFLQPPGLVADGRDMGTVVFPRAEIKFFLLASVEIRALRRHKQLISMGMSANIAQLQKEIAERDERDTNRTVSPNIPAEDAIVIDSSMLGLDQVTELMLSHIKEVI